MGCYHGMVAGAAGGGTPGGGGTTMVLAAGGGAFLLFGLALAFGATLGIVPDFGLRFGAGRFDFARAFGRDFDLVLPCGRVQLGAVVRGCGCELGPRVSNTKAHK